MRIQEIIDAIESVAPLSLQEHWDNSGLQIGDRTQDVTAILLCTDVTEDILEEAYNTHCQLVISHHPLLFHGLKTIQGNTMQERCVVFALRNNISIYSSHIPMDVYLHGVSGHIAEKLGIETYQILSPANQATGFGVIGSLPRPTCFKAFLKQVKDTFGSVAIRYTKSTKEDVERVAICGGAGSDFLQEAIHQGADVYLSADFKYHEFLESIGKIAVVDVGHFESEQYTKEIFQTILMPFRESIEIRMAKSDTCLVHTYIE